MAIFISFGMYSYVIMARPKKTDEKRERLSITLHPTLLKWVKENTGSAVDNKRFRSVSDIVEQALLLLKEKIESEK